MSRPGLPVSLLNTSQTEGVLKNNQAWEVMIIMSFSYAHSIEGSFPSTRAEFSCGVGGATTPSCLLPLTLTHQQADPECSRRQAAGLALSLVGKTANFSAFCPPPFFSPRPKYPAVLFFVSFPISSSLFQVFVPRDEKESRSDLEEDRPTENAPQQSSPRAQSSGRSSLGTNRLTNYRQWPIVEPSASPTSTDRHSSWGLMLASPIMTPHSPIRTELHAEDSEGSSHTQAGRHLTSLAASCAAHDPRQRKAWVRSGLGDWLIGRFDVAAI